MTVEIAPQGALVLVCVKCTRQGIFPADDRDQAVRNANKAGWIQQGLKTICPKDARVYAPAKR